MSFCLTNLPLALPAYIRPGWKSFPEQKRSCVLCLFISDTKTSCMTSTPGRPSWNGDLWVEFPGREFLTVLKSGAGGEPRETANYSRRWTWKSKNKKSRYCLYSDDIFSTKNMWWQLILLIRHYGSGWLTRVHYSYTKGTKNSRKSCKSHRWNWVKI